MRGLDFLESLPEVDRQRMGVCGLSGGGLQSQMLVATDSRIKAATIAGMTCEFRESLFPHNTHCWCNHWPNVTTYTDAPEISALGFPAAVQYLTMNDWTAPLRRRRFSHDPGHLPRERASRPDRVRVLAYRPCLRPSETRAHLLVDGKVAPRQSRGRDPVRARRPCRPSSRRFCWP